MCDFVCQILDANQVLIFSETIQVPYAGPRILSALEKIFMLEADFETGLKQSFFHFNYDLQTEGFSLIINKKQSAQLAFDYHNTNVNE